MARRHHSLFPLILTIALAAAACSSGDTTAEAADDGQEVITTEAPAAPTAGDETTTSIEAAPAEEDAAEPADDVAEESDSSDDGDVEELFPDVLDATATQADDGTWQVNATLSSPYDTPDRYADAWRVIGPDGTEYGIRVLGHDHANEQPFTRSQSGIEIPDGVEVVTIQGRDQVSGWGGDTFELTLPG